MSDVASGRSGLRRRGVVAVVVLAVLTAVMGAVAGWFADRPLYESQGMIQFRPDLGGEPAARYDEFVQSNIALLTKERVLSSAAESDEFRRVVRPAGAAAGPDLRQLIANFRDHLDVRHAPGTSTTVVVRYVAPDPDSARAGVGAVIGSFVSIFGDLSWQDLQMRLGIITNVKNSLTRDIQRMEQQLRDETRDYGTDDLGDVYRMRLQQVADLSRQLTAVKVDLLARQEVTTRATDEGATEALNPRVVVLSRLVEAAQRDALSVGLHRSRVDELKENLRYERERLRKADEEAERLNVKLALNGPIKVESYGDTPVQMAGVRTGSVVGAAVGGLLPLSLAPLVLLRKRKAAAGGGGGTGPGAAAGA